jgi:hypothetical protein
VRALHAVLGIGLALTFGHAAGHGGGLDKKAVTTTARPATITAILRRVLSRSLSTALLGQPSTGSRSLGPNHVPRLAT